MRKLNVIIFIFFLVYNVIGQTYNPLIRPNIYWEVLNGDGHLICNYSGGYRYYFQGDTTILGKTYFKILGNPLVSIATSPPAPAGQYCPPFALNQSDTYNQNIFIREDSVAKKVYVYESNYGDTLLYDFNLTDGDTLKSASNTAGPYKLRVDSVRITSLLSGALRKIFYFHHIANNNRSYCIESIGGSEGLQFHLYNPAEFFGYWHKPICFAENNIPLWGNQCASILGVEEIKSIDLIKVFPNPASNYLQMDSNNGIGATFIVMDLTGRIVLTKKINNNKERIDISILPSGVYIYKNINLNQTVTGKFVVAK